MQRVKTSSTEVALEVVLIGDTSVGKSALIERLFNDSYADSSEPTIGSAFRTKRILIGDLGLKLRVWDTAGQERFQPLVPIYAKGAASLIITFDLTNQDTFAKAKLLFKKFSGTETSETMMVLVGTKSDEQDKRAVAQEDIDKFMQESAGRISSYIETSAKANTNVEKLFSTVAKSIVDQMLRNKNSQQNPNKSDRNTSTDRQILIGDLEKYINRIEAHQKNGKINFKHGFWHHKDSRAFNRQANYLLAKDLLNALKSTEEPISKIFENVNQRRNELITSMGISDKSPNRGINSSTLKKIISNAVKFSAAKKKPAQPMRKPK